jgi:hypothetical protein
MKRNCSLTYFAAMCLVSVNLAVSSAFGVDYPKDPPVATGGEGNTGSDWTDFGALVTSMHGRDAEAETLFMAFTVVIGICGWPAGCL